MEGVHSIRRMLSENSTLKSMCLKSCGVADNKAVALFESLKQNRSVESLDLTSNTIGNRGASTLADYVSSSPVIKKLVLAFHEIGDAGFVALGRALEHNTSLEELTSLSRDNSVAERGVRSLLDGVKRNPTIKVATICPLNLSLQEELDFYLERNKQANPILHANLPLSIWPRVLKRADVCRHGGDHLRGPDMLYYFVKEKCDLFVRGPPRRKRKRTDG